MKAYLLRKFNSLKNFYHMYTSGMAQSDVERLLQKDTLAALEYYKDRTPLGSRTTRPQNFKDHIRVAREIFVSFVMQLTPARRFLYGLSLCGFVLGPFLLGPLGPLTGFVLLNLLLALELADKLVTRDELEIAREIQVSLEPQSLPEFHRLSISALSRPAKIVGGDFFNVVKPNDNRMVSILGDVAGKGIPAALYAAHIQSMFESLSERSVSPAGIMTELNKLISRRLREGDFITAVIAFFESERNALTIARAGHNWPLYYNAKTQAISSLNPPGVCLGLDPDTGFSDCLQEKILPVNPGDVLLLYSDGITEAMNSEACLFEMSRLESALRETVHHPADKIIEGINHRLDDFIQSEELHDDITMVAIKVK
jgi:serine phosphatase RsbU (regulator of sigma subunit)